MKHFSTEEWVDFVNQALTAHQTEAMQKHLATGCKHCAETVSVWQKVRNAAAMEASYQPSTDTLRIAKAAFAASGLARKKKESPSLVEVLFDSFLQPAVAGARSAAVGTRQMLYKAGTYQIDVQIEPKPGSNRIVVTGQLLALGQPGTAGRDIQVTLSNNRGHSAIATTNQFGEFSGEIENSGDLELSIPSDTGRPIVISLRSVLGDLHRGRS
jgi:hypothetical protein